MNLIKKYRVYIVSGVCICITLLVVMIAKSYWPFGDASIISGDFIPQGWSYSVELHNKLVNGESIFYSWNAGYGMNYYSNLAFYFNPFMLLFALVPPTAVLQTSTIAYILTLLLCNWSALYFLTHRPVNALDETDFSNMLFSLSFSLCMYVVSNTNNWNFLISAATYPLIILGLERFVHGQGWRLYAIMLAIAFLSNYYFTGLFCVFIVLYYLTMQFQGWKDFIKKSFKIMVISVVSVGVSGVVFIPTLLQLMSQKYSVQGYSGDVWFTNYYNILQSFFAFNNMVGIGTRDDSYGEVNLYMGLLPILLATMYFMNTGIPRGQRIRKLIVFAVYMVSFDLNILNYYMHLRHYPSWFPNRYSWFFTLYCIILAYDNLTVIKRDKKLRIIPWLASCVLWLAMIALCYIWSDESIHNYVYVYSAVLVGGYLLIYVFQFLNRKVLSIVLMGIGALELMLSFSYSIIFRNAIVSIPANNDSYVQLKQILQDHCSDEIYGFSRIVPERDLFTQDNSGLLLNYKSPTIFASSINDSGYFLAQVGVYSSPNVFRGFTYFPSSLSMLNVQYIYMDHQVIDSNRPGVLKSTREDEYEQYPLIYSDGTIDVRENKEALALGYMIDQPIMIEHNMDYDLNMNTWLEQACGISDVMKPVELNVVDANTTNCQLLLMGQDLMIAHGLTAESIGTISTSDLNYLMKLDDQKYDSDKDSYVELIVEAQESGDYYLQVGLEVIGLGYLEKGEQAHALIRVLKASLQDYTEQYHVDLYKFDNDVWTMAYNQLSQHQMDVQEAAADRIYGVIDAGDGGLMFTSIPCDPSWHVYVDGEETEIIEMDLSSFIGVELPAGVHKVEFRYKQRGFWIGALVSCVSIMVLCAAGIRYRKEEGYDDIKQA